jgi:hypothetical protein
MALTSDPEQERTLPLCAVCKEIRILVMDTFCPFLVVGQTRLQEREVRGLDLLGWHGGLLVESAEIGKIDRLFWRCCVGVV